MSSHGRSGGALIRPQHRNLISNKNHDCNARHPPGQGGRAAHSAGLAGRNTTIEPFKLTGSAAKLIPEGGNAVRVATMSARIAVSRASHMQRRARHRPDGSLARNGQRTARTSLQGSRPLPFVLAAPPYRSNSRSRLAFPPQYLAAMMSWHLPQASQLSHRVCDHRVIQLYTARTCYRGNRFHALFESSCLRHD
jgi:hypothetical protein